jgi:hypothetical protein
LMLEICSFSMRLFILDSPKLIYEWLQKMTMISEHTVIDGADSI